MINSEEEKKKRLKEKNIMKEKEAGLHGVYVITQNATVLLTGI